MIKKDSDGFILGDDQEDAVEAMPKKENEDIQFQRLSQRVTLISVIIPILIGIIGYFIYNDIQKKVTKVHDTGSTEVQTLSKDTESKFSSLSVQLSKLEQSVSDRTQTIDQKLTDIKKDINWLSVKLKKAEGKLSDLEKSSSSLEGKIKPLEKNLAGIKQDITDTQKRMAQTVSNVEIDLEKTKSTLLNLNSKFSTIASSKLDRTTFIEEVDKLNETIDKSFFDMNRKLNNLDAKINRMSTPSSSARPAPSSSGNKPASSAGTIQMTRTKPDDSPPPDSDLLEQDIKE